MGLKKSNSLSLANFYTISMDFGEIIFREMKLWGVLTVIKEKRGAYH